jgi:hypothetical protein
VSQPCPRQQSTARSAGDTWTSTTVRRSHRTVRCATELSDVPRGSWLQWSTSPEKEGNRTVHCPVHPRTKGNYDLPNGVPMAPGCLRAIKGTPRRMEQYTKHPLNILRNRDFEYTRLVHCDRDSSTYLSCNSNVLLFVCSFLSCVRVVPATLALVCVAILPLLSCSFEIICVRRERLQSVKIPHKGILLR